MKKNRLRAIAAIAIVAILVLITCLYFFQAGHLDDARKNAATPSNTQTNVAESNAMTPTREGKGAMQSQDNDGEAPQAAIAQNGSERIRIAAGDVDIYATLNDTVAAQDFKTRLPLTVRGSDSGIDYCCTLSEGKVDDAERQAGWKNGDISLAGGWLAMLYSGEESSRSYPGLMIIAHMDDGFAEKIASLPSSAEFTISLEE